MKTTLFGLAALLLTVSAAQAVVIGNFPGLDELIKQSDAIVILRIDHQADLRSIPDTLYATHDCYVYQTLKGNIPANKRIRLQLMDTHASFVTPFARFSTHLMCLTTQHGADDRTTFRTIPFRGANVRLSPTGHEKRPTGKTVADQIRSILQRTTDYNQKQHEQQQAFMKQMITGTAESRDAPAGK